MGNTIHGGSRGAEERRRNECVWLDTEASQYIQTANAGTGDVLIGG